MLTAFLPPSVTAVLNEPISSLSDDQLSTIMADIGLGHWHPDLRVALGHVLQERGLSTAADAIQHPEALKQLAGIIKSFRRNIKPDEVCSYCGGALAGEHGARFCTLCHIHH